jgi:hypothetical protein
MAPGALAGRVTAKTIDAERSKIKKAAACTENQPKRV